MDKNTCFNNKQLNNILLKDRRKSIVGFFCGLFCVLEINEKNIFKIFFAESCYFDIFRITYMKGKKESTYFRI